MADPEPQPRLVDRALVAAYDAGLAPLLILTRCDLAEPDQFLRLYGALGVGHVLVRRHGGLDPLRRALRDRVTVLVGSSGVAADTGERAGAGG